MLVLCSSIDTARAEIVRLENGKINYAKTPCIEGLTELIDRESPLYDAWMKDHFSNPDFISNLLPVALSKFKFYRQTLEDELHRYTANAGSLLSTQTVLLDQCRTMIDIEIHTRKTHLTSYIYSLSGDKKTLRITKRLSSINEKAVNQIHTPFANLLGRMKSFSDRLPCISTKCTR